MNIFSLLTKALLSQSPIATSLFNKLAKALKLSPSNLARSLINTPEKLATELAATKGLKGVNGILNDLNKSISKRVNIGDILGAAGKEKRRELGNNIADQLEGENQFDTAVLSSSWLIAGTFERTSAFTDTGAFTGTTKKGATYTWYNMPLSVWEAMKEARGRNGSGAGSVFWALYLRAYKRSPAQQSLALVFKLAGVSGRRRNRL